MLLSTSTTTGGDQAAITALEIAVWQTGQGSAIVVLSGDLDLAVAPKLRQRLADLADCEVINLELDLANLEFIDSSGISIIVGTLEHLRAQGGSLVVRNASPMAAKVFEITGLTEYLSVTGCDDLATVEAPHAERSPSDPSGGPTS
jgi:anti-sigma B factor antagonist